MTEQMLTRELAALREQLDEGELDAAAYGDLRQRLILRAAAGADLQSRRAPTGWRWAVGGIVAALLVVAALVPALRERGPGDFSSGNDFAPASEELGSGEREWLAAERALDAGDTGAAVRRFRLAVAFLPDRADLRARFGFVLAQAGRPSEALRQLRLAMRSAPRLPAVRLYLGAVLVQTGRQRAGARQLRRYLALEPEGEASALARRLLASR